MCVSGCAMADEASARVGRQEDPACPHFCLLRALWLKRGAEGGGMPRVPSSVPLCLCIPPCRIEKKVDLRGLLSQAGGGRRRRSKQGKGCISCGKPRCSRRVLGPLSFSTGGGGGRGGRVCGEGRLTGLTARANSGLAREYRRSPAEVLCTEREGAALTPEAARKVEHRKNASKDPSLPKRLLPASLYAFVDLPTCLLLSCIATERSVVPFPPLSRLG